jgi:hypothetical protein
MFGTKIALPEDELSLEIGFDQARVTSPLSRNYSEEVLLYPSSINPFFTQSEDEPLYSRC